MLDEQALLRKKREMEALHKGTPVEKDYKETSKYLCDVCEANAECELAFDGYNLIPEGAGPDYNDFCLAEK
jgi:hypothetical protein